MLTDDKSCCVCVTFELREELFQLTIHLSCCNAESFEGEQSANRILMRVLICEIKALVSELHIFHALVKSQSGRLLLKRTVGPFMHRAKAFYQCLASRFHRTIHTDIDRIAIFRRHCDWNFHSINALYSFLIYHFCSLLVLFAVTSHRITERRQAARSTKPAEPTRWFIAFMGKWLPTVAMQSHWKLKPSNRQTVSPSVSSVRAVGGNLEIGLKIDVTIELSRAKPRKC